MAQRLLLNHIKKSTYTMSHQQNFFKQQHIYKVHASFWAQISKLADGQLIYVDTDQSYYH